MEMITGEAILENIKDIADKLGHTPTRIEYGNHPERICSPAYVRTKFGNWNDALKKAGLRLHRYNKNDKELILQNIKNVVEALGYIPLFKQYLAHPLAQFDEYRITRLFSGWKNAIKETGLPYQYKRSLCCYNREDIIKNIQAAAKAIGHTPSGNEYGRYSSRICSPAHVYRIFGSWNNAITAASLPIVHHMNISKEELLEELYRVAIKNPDIHEIRPLIERTSYSRDSYQVYIGTAKEIKKALYITYGLKIHKRQNRDDETLYITWIKKYINEFGYSPTKKEFEKYSGLPITSLTKHVNTRMSYLIYKAGGHLRIISQAAKETLPASYIRKEIIWRIQQIYEKVKKTKEKVIFSDISKRLCAYCKKTTVKEYFQTLDNAIKAAKVNIHRKPHCWTRQELIRSVKKVAKDLGHTPTRLEYINHPYGIKTYLCFKKLFGTWNNALQEAKLPVRKYKEGTPKEEIIKQLHAILKQIGRRPSTIQYNKIKGRLVNASQLYRIFGSYEKAWELAKSYKTKKAG